MTNPGDHLACAHCRRKISALRAPENCIEKTVPPRWIVRRSWRAVAFFPGSNGRSLAPIGKELVQFHNVSGICRRSGHICAQANGGDRRARRNTSGDVER